jgi:lysophospholipase L1-like esterase
MNIIFRSTQIKGTIFLILLNFSAFLPFAVFGFSKGDPDKKEIQDLKIRKGLPNFFAKAIHGDSIKVAYFGGSITAQNGWRVSSLDWFKQRFPKAVFSEINAAIGGTGSDFGVFRLRDHVLKYKPDLVFVEFAVNDGNTPSERIIRSMEGIVRQILQQNSFTDICFVYTIKGDYLEAEQNGNLPNSAENMEKVAGHYGIPSINFGFEVANMVSSNQLIMKGKSMELNGLKVFSPDGVHPYPETGHVIYQNVLKRSFESMISNNSFKTKKHILPKPLAPDYFANTQMFDCTNAKLSSNWKILNIKDQPLFSGFGKYLKFIGKANQSGETLSFRFKGRAIGVYDIMGPDAGRIIIEIDGVVKDTISRFDAYCTYRRMNYFVIDDLINKKHEVVFKTLCEPFDKVGILQKRNEVMKNPDDYKENNWYVGKILIDGILSK